MGMCARTHRPTQHVPPHTIPLTRRLAPYTPHPTPCVPARNLRYYWTMLASILKIDVTGGVFNHLRWGCGVSDAELEGAVFQDANAAYIQAETPAQRCVVRRSGIGRGHGVGWL